MCRCLFYTGIYGTSQSNATHCVPKMTSKFGVQKTKNKGKFPTDKEYTRVFTAPLNKCYSWGDHMMHVDNRSCFYRDVAAVLVADGGQ